MMGALPKALAHRGHRVMVVAPRYANYDDAWETGVRATFSVFNSSHEVRGAMAAVLRAGACAVWMACLVTAGQQHAGREHQWQQ